jgi:hypothetical protein
MDGEGLRGAWGAGNLGERREEEFKYGTMGVLKTKWEGLERGGSVNRSGGARGASGEDLTARGRKDGILFSFLCLVILAGIPSE